MTRKDYKALAEILKDSYPATMPKDLAEYQQWHKALTENFADMLQADNPRFDRAKFMSACGFNV